MNTRTLVIACFLLILGNSAHAQWVQTNSPKNPVLTFGGDITCLASMGNDLFAGTATAGLILSTDSGTTWSAVRILPSFLNVSFGIGALCVSGGNLFAATGDALYLSTDSGASWEGLSFPSDPDASSINAITVSGGNLIVAVGNDSTRLSMDTGKSWIGIPLSSINSFASMGGNIYVTSGYGIFRSTNNGVNWTPTDTARMYVSALAVNGDDLFVDTYYGVSLSTDEGASWMAIDSGLRGVIITSLAVSGGNVFAGTDGNGVFVTTNNGTSWNPTGDTGLTNATVNTLLVDSGKLYAGTYGGVFLSTDNGAHWSVHNPISVLDAQINSMDTIGGKLFASTQQGLFSTTDSGAIWTPDSAGIGMLPVSAVVSIAENIFAGTNGSGVLLSTNNGASWTAVDSGLTGQDLSVSTFVQSDGVLYIGTDGGIFLSTNNGINWIGPGAVGADVLTVIDGNIIAATQATGDIYYSRDSGKFWSGADMPVVVSNAFTIIGRDVYVATNGDGVWRSADSGIKWTKPNDLDLTDTDITALMANGTTLYAGTSIGHVFVSSDSGASWEQIDSGLNLGGTEITSLAIKDSNLYAGTSDSGIWRHSLSKTVTRPSAVLQTPIRSPDIQIYPNPAMGSITVTSTAGPVSILDPLGRSYEVRQMGNTLDISSLPSGVYFVSDGVSRVKFVKE